MGGVHQEGPGISTEGAVRELEVKWSTWWCKRKGETRELTGHKVDRYAQTDYICVPTELTYTRQPTQSILEAQQCIPMNAYVSVVLWRCIYRVGLQSGVESMLLSH